VKQIEALTLQAKSDKVKMVFTQSKVLGGNRLLIYLQMIESEQDQVKFLQLYERYRGLMFYVANQILHSEQDAEDAVYEAFVSITENLKKISDVECPKTRSYAVIIVERKAIDILRARSKIVHMDSEDALGGLEVPPPGDGGLADAMANLPARYREVLLLRYDSGYSVKEIARIFDMKPPAVQKLIERAKSALQKKLEQGDMPV
jgi:RNA polymerase sigma-70 factor (ECF subfamily)